MNVSVVFDWKSFAALGGAIVLAIFALKMDCAAAERVSTHAVDACREYAVAVNGN